IIGKLVLKIPKIAQKLTASETSDQLNSNLFHCGYFPYWGNRSPSPGLTSPKWRPFCLKFDGIVEDFNYGTLLRLNCSQGYTEENTIFAPRIQFFAIEIARNREGYNKAVYTGIKDKEEKEASNGGDKGANSREEEKGANREGEKEKEAYKEINKSSETTM
ncbi:hypothetical protein FD755_025727, partial [Muntiacus reevesi]